jgi:cell division protein FtsB
MLDIILSIVMLCLIGVMIWSGETVLKAGRDNIAFMKELEQNANEQTAKLRKQNEQLRQNIEHLRSR